MKVDGGGLRDDAEKNKLDLLPWDALEQVGHVLSRGAKKYAPRNWERGMAWSHVTGSLHRHLSKWMQGEDIDPETGISHMAHVACNALFLVAYEQRHIGTDDRPKLRKYSDRVLTFPDVSVMPRKDAEFHAKTQDRPQVG